MLTKVRKYWMRMAGIMDQATCGEVHNANLRSVFPTGSRTRLGKNLPLCFLNSRILLKKTPVFLDFADMRSLKSYPFLREIVTK